MSTLVVDWLGRGGIAQTAEAWALELARSGERTAIATRAGRELAQAAVPVVAAEATGGRLRTHAALVRAVARAIREVRPATVVVQNYLVAAMEEPVHRAARAVGARVVVVVHDHQHHTRMSGVRAGLRGQLRRADVVVAHSHFVGESIERWSGRSVDAVLPHPVAVGVVEAVRPNATPLDRIASPIALHLGVLTRRSNKGTEAVIELAERGVDGWEVAFAGVGAPHPCGAVSVDRFLDAGELAALVERSTACLLPYRFASQSGVVALAQALGAVPIVTAVGGLPEQVEHGISGLVLPAGAGALQLAEALRSLDAAACGAIADKARATAWERHAEFAAEVRRLSA